MDKFLIIVRHGDYAGSGDEPLSKFGIEQMQMLKKVITSFISAEAKKTGQERIPSLFFSFSSLERAVQSIRELRWTGGDIIIISAGDANRRDITEPRKTLDKVMGLANYYGADVIVIIAHGEMPAVIAETASESVTGKKVEKNLDMPGKGRGYIVNMVTGEVTPIGWDSLDEKKKPLQPVVQETPKQHIVAKDRPKHVLRPAGGPYPQNVGPYPDPDDDIPF